MCLIGAACSSKSSSAIPAGFGAAGSISEIEAQLNAAAPSSDAAFLVAEPVQGDCRALWARNADEPLSLASTVKLYVLAAVARSVLDGSVAWDDELVIAPGNRVHSSRVTDRVEDGERMTVRDLARAMMATSDNTATDVLIQRMGRDAVEAAAVSMGMARVQANQPFLSPRELSLLKFGTGDGERYASLDAAARRELLGTLVGWPATAASLDFEAGPRLVDELEWFGSAMDLCRAAARLRQMAGEGTVLRGVLEAGLRDLRFPYAMVKMGSEPGVLAGVLHVELCGDRSRVVALLLRDTRSAIHVDGYGALRRAAELLASEEACGLPGR